MSSDPDLHALLAPMRERDVELEAPEFQVDRERVLARMARAADTRVSERPRWAGYAVLTAAAAVMLGVGVHAWRARGVENASLEVAVGHGSATQSNAGTRIVLGTSATRVPAAGELETAPGATASVRTAQGLQIQLESATSVALGELAPSTNRITLAHGSIRCNVPHGKIAQPFRVVTARATIVDVGTVFRVSVTEAQETRVTVDEGEVRVQSASGETSVRAPGSWTSESSTPSANLEPSTSANPSATSLAPPIAPAAANPSHSSIKPSASAAPVPTLAAESQLLRQGLSAERQGRSSDAIGAFNQLLNQYPDSPLAPDARAALARVRAASHE